MLLVFTAGMATARPALLSSGFALLLLLYALARVPSPVALARMFKRLRWLLLAILIVYGWWTPGISLWPGAGVWSPTVDGLYLGMLRVVALITIVAAVHLLLQSTPREDLLPAIMQLVRPLTSRDLRERIAVRTLLSIEAVAQVQSLASDVLREYPVTTGNLSNLARASQLLYKNVLDRAAHSGNTLIEVRKLTAPPWWQWLIPLAMIAMMLVVV